MPKVHSHYENLKIPRDATPEAIRVAYRALSQKHHPDRNPDQKDATRIMMVINTAYETLSDPGKRRQHDDWIAKAEGRPPPASSAGSPEGAGGGASRQRSRGGEGARRGSRRSSRPSAPPATNAFSAHLARYRFHYGLAVIVLAFLWVFLKPAPTPVEDSPFGPRTAFDPKLFPAYEPPAATSEAREEAAPAEAAGKPANPAAAQPLAPPSRIAPLPATETVRYRRPATAPNGQPWPTEPTYVRGYQMLRADGLSSATIDNSRNGADIFAKLVYLDGGHSIPARVFYIPGFKTITLTNINPGRYDLRYRDLNSGELTRTTPFILKESPKIGSVEASSFTLAITGSRAGNLHLHGLSENEF